MAQVEDSGTGFSAKPDALTDTTAACTLVPAQTAAITTAAAHTLPSCFITTPSQLDKFGSVLQTTVPAQKMACILANHHLFYFKFLHVPGDCVRGISAYAIAVRAMTRTCD